MKKTKEREGERVPITQASYEQQLDEMNWLELLLLLLRGLRYIV